MTEPGGGRVWGVLMPVAFTLCGALLAWVLTMEGKSAGSEVLATQQTAAIVRHDAALEEIRKKEAADSERVKGIEMDMSYVKDQTKDIRHAVDGITAMLTERSKR